MRRLLTATLILGALGCVSCKREPPQEPRGATVLQVYVHWEETPLPDKLLEVVELGLRDSTDAHGIAEFSVPAGTYTLRAYGITTGGPGLSYVDYPVTVADRKTTRLDVVDCLPCEAPAPKRPAAPE